jgi:hypothetical protein
MIASSNRLSKPDQKLSVLKASIGRGEAAARATGCRAQDASDETNGLRHAVSQ